MREEEKSMSKENIKKETGKHLTGDDREFIAEALKINMTFKEIGGNLKKDPSTISKEIKTNRSFKKAGYLVDNKPNLCIHRKGCKESYICEPEQRGKHCLSGCYKCVYCNEMCRKFEKEECEKLKKASYVCNGCTKKTSCRLEKYYYNALTAQRKYEQRLHTSRMGINIGEEELMELDNFISPLIKKGQPISHIYNIANDKIPCSKTTLYRYINSGVLSVRNIDLRSVVRYRPRRKRYIPKIKSHSRDNRTYTDFLQFIEDNPSFHIWEMDIVEGKKGGKVLLTLFSRTTRLMLIYLLEKNTQDEILATINYLEEQVGAGLFLKTFEVILTDNGSAFLIANEIETSCYSFTKRCHLFYCDPYASYQKGAIEKNHEYIRWILPKGSSFNDLTWYDIALIASHINSIARGSLDGLTPYKAMKSLNPSLLDRVYLTPIKLESLTLTPDLLK